MKHHLNETSSTNAWMSAKLRELRTNGEAIPDLWAVFADYQTAGRGAGTNIWHSSPGLNILTSICFDTGLAAADQFVFNLWFATATRKFLAKYVPDVRIKWPNDMYVHDRKLAGDLTEHALSGNRLDYTVAGIGINVNEEIFPDWIPNPTSLKTVTGGEYIPEDELVPLLERIFEEYDNLSDDTARRYMDLLYLKGIRHQYTDTSTGRQFWGTITSVVKDGRLEIKTADGYYRYFAFKEVAY